MSSDLSETRSCCPVCDAPVSEGAAVCVTPALPVFQGLVDAGEGGPAPESDVSAAQEWLACGACDAAYLLRVQPLSLVYGGQHAGSFGAVWDAHHAALARFVLAHARGDVLEAGGGVGRLAAEYARAGGLARWRIVEANPSGALAPGCDAARVSIEAGFFGPHTALRDARTLVFSHCLEHFYALGAAVRDVAARLPERGVSIVSWPLTDAWLPARVPGAINWEHAHHVPLGALVELHEAAGLRLLAREQFAEHSAFLAFEKDAAAAPPRAPRWPARAPGGGSAPAVAAYWAYFADAARRVSAALRDAPAPHFLMPASYCAQLLLAFGVTSPSGIAGLLDNAPAKLGRRLYGTRLVARRPADAIAQGDATVVVIGSLFTEEISAGLRALNPRVTILTA
jgi:hypothetical protein